MIDILSILQELATIRPVFYSEADFQHALAWGLHEYLPDEAKVRLEYPPPGIKKKMYLDIWISYAGEVISIELKYKTRAINVQVGEENFALKNQSAQDIGRYDFIKDIYRLEQIKKAYARNQGYAILLTNDSTYWKFAQRDNTVDTDFRLHNGRILAGELAWHNAAAGTMHGRADPLILQGKYLLSWQDYSRLDANSYSQFRYLVVQL